MISDEEILKLPKDNFQKKLDDIIKKNTAAGVRPKLLLHSCCAPCSSYCLEYLRQYFDITDFYYNPNITEEAEYRKRTDEIKRLITVMNSEDETLPIGFEEGRYDSREFFDAVKGFESEPEGGLRCVKCFRLRLYETARVAAEGHFDCFTTTLTISPLKNASVLNHIGEEAGREFGVMFLPSDFKKKEGYKRSVELSEKYGLYRQDYCGCGFSKGEIQGCSV